MANPGYYIWVNGFPGVGKLTVAKELHRMIEGSLLIDNHQLIDVVNLPREHPEYHAERRRVREEAFRTWVYCEGGVGEGDAEKMERCVIFTDCVTFSDLGASMAAEHRAAAEKAGRPFLPVYLHCARDVNLKRVVTEERLQGKKKKLLDVEHLAVVLDTMESFKWPDVGVEIDVTELEPAETARRIIREMI